jgi:5-methylcytosine-specific restriction endonuclease McrA
MIGIPKPVSRAGERRKTRRAKEDAWQKVRRLVLARDGRRCRVCSSRDQIEAHHIRFRSLGGTHTTANTACLCAVCHADVHAYRLTLSGNADAILKIERAA